ncbi:MAG: hypothetical protein ACKVPY_02460 [Paracoccaceae bacterium]
MDRIAPANLPARKRAVMSLKFPRRTIESDDAGFLAERALRGLTIARGFMVSAVTSRSGRFFIGLSGNRPAVAAQLEAALGLGHNDLTDSAVRRAEVRVSSWEAETAAARQRTIARHHPLGMQAQLAKFGMHAPIGANSVTTRDLDMIRDFLELRKAKRTQVLAAQQGPMVDALQTDLQKAFGPPLGTGNWNCSEPKALMDAALHGGGVTGMTTIWHGAAADPDIQKYLTAEGRLQLSPPVGGGAHRAKSELLFCRPCNECQVNEHRIMSVVEHLSHPASARPKSYEAPF